MYIYLTNNVILDNAEEMQTSLITNHNYEAFIFEAKYLFFWLDRIFFSIFSPERSNGQRRERRNLMDGAHFVFSLSLSSTHVSCKYGVERKKHAQSILSIFTLIYIPLRKKQRNNYNLTNELANALTTSHDPPIENRDLNRCRLIPFVFFLYDFAN